MDLLTAWLLFPLVALGLCGALGLLVALLGGAPLPGTLLLGCGLCGLVVVTQLTTAFAALAPATVAVVLMLAAAGVAWGARLLRGGVPQNAPISPASRHTPRAVAGEPRPDGWAAAAALMTFAMAGAAVVLSGDATLPGYTVLADVSIHLMGADALLEHGRDFGELPASSYQAALVSYYNGSAYPAGGPTALGALARVAGEDPLWAFAPFMALLVAVLALALYELAGVALRRGPARAAVALVAAQPALVTTYALQGSVKEIGAAALTGVLAALVPWYVRRRREGGGPRALVAPAVVTAATCAVVGAVGLVWCGPLLAAAVVAGTRAAPARGRADLAISAAVLAAVVAALSVQTISGLDTYLDVTNSGRTAEARMGNLKEPLSPAQALGVWLRGDHRDRPTGAALAGTRALELLVALAVITGAVLLVRRRRWGAVLYLAVMAGAVPLLVWQGTPWSDAKAYMIASPALLFTALLGAALLVEDRGTRRLARGTAAALAGTIAAGVVASNALAYREASLAPRERLDELAAINERFAGEGPALTPEYEELGKYVLRDLAPESPVEGWRSRELELAAPDDPPNLLGTSVEVGQLADRYVRAFPLLVLRRGFAESRAPYGYARVRAGRWYDVWARRPGADAAVLGTVAAGRGRQASGVPDCAAIGRLAARARRAGGSLAWVPRPAAPVFAPGAVRHSWNWLTDTGDPEVVVLFGPGRARGRVTVAQDGRYDVWVEARVGRPVEVLVDGRPAGTVAWRLNPRRSAERAGSVRLAAGRHELEVRVGGGGARPGAGGVNRIVGPVGLVPGDQGALPVRRTAPDRWRSLCGREMDWVSAVSEQGGRLEE